ncbi:MAG: Ig-like domain-containing protein [Prevotella sp.]|nr:Ig-like domain-containing protein [Prevotella sp.]MBR6852699.1 Ig-like domain-containing protein [Prevotella sp.]
MIPVSFIKQEAFIGSNLKSIVIPGSVKTIDHRALMYSNTHNAYEELPEDGLESAFLMEGVEVMRDRIFHGNKYMKKVFLPSTLTDIGFYSFFGTAIEDVYFGGTEEQWNALKNLENAKLPETAKIHFNSNFTAAFINSIEVEEDYVEIAVGEEYEIEASIIPEEIAPVVALTYTSSNEEVATVDEEGVVTGIADGYVTITVSAGEGVEAKVRVKVGDAQQERENVLTMDFEDGEVADYWALAIAESQLVEPTAEGSTGRAAAVVSGSDRGDYVKVNADLEGATKYEVAMDLLLYKSPKTTQFSVLNASSWDTWTTNWGMFWKDTKAQSHNPFLFNLDIAGNSNTANVNIDIDAEGNGVAAQQTWDFENGVWYTLTLAVDVNAHTVDYVIAPKSDLTAVAVSGTYTAPADEMMQIKGIYERNGRYNYSPGAIAIDNVIVDVTERGFVEGQGGNQATGISEAKAEKSVKNGKYVENGQIVIYIDGKKFNAAGQQVK